MLLLVLIPRNPTSTLSSSLHITSRCRLTSHLLPQSQRPKGSSCASHSLSTRLSWTRIDIRHFRRQNPRADRGLGRGTASSSHPAGKHQLTLPSIQVLYANAHPSMSHVSPDFIPVFGDCIRMIRQVAADSSAEHFHSLFIFSSAERSCSPQTASRFSSLDQEP